MYNSIAVLDKREGNTKLSVSDEQHCERLGDVTVFFNGRIHFPISSKLGKEIITERLRQADHLKASEKFLEEIEGDFVFIVVEPERIIAGRDPMGVQPLHYGQNERFLAIASNRRVLWQLGVKEVHSFPPGHVGLFSLETSKIKPVKTFVCREQKNFSMQEAAGILEKLLERSVRERVSGIKDIAIAFSGGLDSSVVAYLAQKCKVNVQLIHVSLESQPETEEAEKAANALDLPLEVCLFREEDVERIVSKVVELIEEADPVKVSVGLPFYWTAEKTAELGLKVLMAGQGADELFGGYQRYVNEYLLRGKEKVRKTMFNDVVRLHENNIEGGIKICNFHDVKLLLPFGSYQVANFAITLPVELKIEKRADTLRKLVLRKTAQNIGLPSSISEKPKKAVQYSTGISKTLKRIAKRHEKTLAEYLEKLFLNQLLQN